MAASITRSLDTLTQQTSNALSALAQLKRKESELADELARKQENMKLQLEEYRKGLFCSGCGQTKSEILAKGESFPHPGQKIIRPTASQIESRERQLQAQVDSARARLEKAAKDSEAQQHKADAGIEQIRLGGRLWRTAASYWDFAWARSMQLQQEHDEQRLASASQALKEARAASAAGKDAAGDVQTWVRLVGKFEGEARAAKADADSRTRSVRRQLADELRLIQSYVLRGELHGKVSGPPGVALLPSGTDDDLGGLYQMGEIPAAGTRYAAKANVSSFLASYRSFGGSGTLQSTGELDAPPAQQRAGSSAPAPTRAPAAGAATDLLDRLP